MTSEAKTVEEYLNSLPEERKIQVEKLHQLLLDHLPHGFEAGMNYGMLGYYVPHTLYPKGYHCKPTDPLPFLALASQKNSINFYHMGMYANAALYEWFVSEYPKYCTRKLDIGKSCMRFKKEEDIPFELLAQLVTKISVQDWITMYESNFLKK
jgi:hypothetical protein